MKYLDDDTFGSIIKHTPLVSIDLIIINNDDKILLGLRKNAPAKYYWFVPGGRICKDEPFSEAFERIVHTETGMSKSITEAKFLGVYEHIYPGENTFNTNYSTHYIVNAFELRVQLEIEQLPMSQHNNYCFISIEQLLNDEKVHPFVKNYFNGHRLY